MRGRDVELLLLRTRHLRKDATPRKQQPTDEERTAILEVPSLDHLIDSPASESPSIGLEL